MARRRWWWPLTVLQWRLLASRPIVVVLIAAWFAVLVLGAAWEEDLLATAPLLLVFLAVVTYSGVWGGQDEGALRRWLAGSPVSPRVGLLASVLGRTAPLAMAVVVQAVVVHAAWSPASGGLSVAEQVAWGLALVVQTAGVCTALSLLLPGATNAVAFLILAAGAFYSLSDEVFWSSGKRVALAVLNPLFWIVPERTALSTWGPLATGLVLLAVAFLAVPARRAAAAGAPAGAVLVVEDVGTSFRRFPFRTKHVLHGVSFIVPQGRILGLLGRNGAGKTTTLRTVLGELAPGPGQVRCGAGASGVVRYLPETDPLAAGLKPRHYLPLFADEDPERVERLASLLHVGDLLDARAGALSFGQRRRSALLLTVAARAPLFLLDEPATGIDPLELEAMKGMLRELRAEGAAVLLSTHLLREFEDIFDEVVLLDEGRVLAAGAVADLRGRVTVVALDSADGQLADLPAATVCSGSRVIGPAEARETLLTALAAKGASLREVPATLHDVFSWVVRSSTDGARTCGPQ